MNEAAAYSGAAAYTSVFLLCVVTFSLSMASSRPGLSLICSPRWDSAPLDQADTHLAGLVSATAGNTIIKMNVTIIHAVVNR